MRTTDQLNAEAELVAGVLLDDIEQIVCFAPTGHLFGHLYGEVLPAMTGITAVHASADPMTRPRFDPQLRTLFVCLPSSWMILRGLTAEIATLPAAVALHGTGPVTEAVHRVVTDLADVAFRAVEIFGSTETGAVAVRDLPADGPWMLLPDVEVADAPLLTVRSPRLARRADMAERPEWWRLEDVVCVVDERRFEFVGRSSRLIKVNGVRCDLGDVEDAVCAGIPGIDVVCVAVRDSVRGEYYDLFHAGVQASVEDVWQTLKGFPLPRAVYQVPEIPRTVTGKPKLDRLDASTGT
ncbi:MAG: hypothetical protein WKF47_15995 [Geodermatophilaceae bacterium]